MTDQDEADELAVLREFHRTWKVLHMDPERRIKLQAAAKLIGISHQLDAMKPPHEESKVKAELTLIYGDKRG
jgi:hypothetical protein